MVALDKQNQVWKRTTSLTDTDELSLQKHPLQKTVGSTYCVDFIANEEVCRHSASANNRLYMLAMGSANLTELCKQYQPLQHPQNFTSGSKLCRQ